MKSKFKIKKLGDFITEVSIRNNNKIKNEVFSVTNSDGFIKSTDYFDKEVFSKNISNYKIVKPKQFAYNPSRINIGSIDFLQTDFAVAISPFYIVFDCNKSFLEDYLLLYLKSPVGKIQIRNKTRGAVRDNLTFSSLCEINIPVPTIQEQSQIIKLLSKIDELLQKRKISINLLDTILPTLFNKLFGNPLRNEMGWKIEKFDKYLLDIIAGSSAGGEEKDELLEKEVGILKTSSVTKGRFNPKEFKVVRWDKLGSKLVNPQEGDLLFSRANTRELVGATCIVDKNYYNLFLPDKLWVLMVNELDLNKVFLHFLFQNPSFKNRFTLTATGSSSSMLNISMQKLRNVSIPIPSMALQIKFANAYNIVETTRLFYEKSLLILQKINESISYRALRGELDLSRIEFDHIFPEVYTSREDNKNIDIISKNENKRIINKKGSIIKLIANKHFKNKSFSYQELAEKIQDSLIEEEYDYNKIKQQIFDSLQGKGDIKLKQIFNNENKTIVFRIEK